MDALGSYVPPVHNAVSAVVSVGGPVTRIPAQTVNYAASGSTYYYVGVQSAATTYILAKSAAKDVKAAKQSYARKDYVGTTKHAIKAAGKGLATVAIPVIAASFILKDLAIKFGWSE